MICTAAAAATADAQEAAPGVLSQQQLGIFASLATDPGKALNPCTLSPELPAFNPHCRGSGCLRMQCLPCHVSQASLVAPGTPPLEGAIVFCCSLPGSMLMTNQGCSIVASVPSAAVLPADNAAHACWAGLQPLVPYFLKLIAEEVPKQLRSLPILYLLLKV